MKNLKGKSKVWSHFSLKRKKETNEIAENVAVCDRCHTLVKYSGGTTNLTTHLERHHKILKTSASQSSGAVSGTSSFVKTEQPKVYELFNKSAAYKSDSARAKLVTLKIGRFIVKDLRPFSVVSNQGFRDLVHTLDPKYVIPSRTYFSDTVIPDMYEQVKTEVLASLSKATQVSLTTDGWTSRATESYITITSCHITEDWTFQNYVLQTRYIGESHTGQNIANVLSQAIIEWGLPGHPALVSDNAANMLVAARELGSNPHLPCYAHTLNLAVQKGIKTRSIDRLLGRIRRVVAFFHRSTTAAAVLKAKCKLLNLREVKLIQDVSTRWNSAVDMLERFLELQPAVYATLISREIKSKEKDNIATLSEDDITLAENAMAVLVPLRTVTTALCSESMPTASLIMPLQKKLLTKELVCTESDAESVKQLKTTISDDLRPRYSAQKEFLEETSLLDPRFKTSYLTEEEGFIVITRVTSEAANAPVIIKKEPGVNTAAPAAVPPQEPPLPQLDQDPIADVRQEQAGPSDVTDVSVDPEDTKPVGLASFLEDVIITKTEKATKTKLDQAKQEMEVYMNSDMLNLKTDPLLWWREHSWRFPLLSALAKQRLSVPATSVPSERVFSTAGDILSAQRAAMGADKVDMLIFLKKNMP